MADSLNEPDAAPLAFIDLEASGFGPSSWPVEVGWAFEAGAATSLLIKPHATWTDKYWDGAAQRLHGLSRADLDRDGLDPAIVCRRLNDALAGVRVQSDLLEWDSYWLFRLYSAAGAKQAFALEDFGLLMLPLARGREKALLARAAETAPRRHRAGADALHLQTLYRLAAAPVE
jgi:hypothetical protein